MSAFVKGQHVKITALNQVGQVVSVSTNPRFKASIEVYVAGWQEPRYFRPSELEPAPATPVVQFGKVGP